MLRKGDDSGDVKDFYEQLGQKGCSHIEGCWNVDFKRCGE